MSAIVAPEHRQTARKLRALLGVFEAKRDLASMGAYAKAGTSSTFWSGDISWRPVGAATDAGIAGHIDSPVVPTHRRTPPVPRQLRFHPRHRIGAHEGSAGKRGMRYRRTAMTRSDTAFIGSIPELYDRHLGPVLFEPYASEIARRLPPEASRVLEVAAGTGRVSRHLLKALPAAGTLLATDLNDAMLVRAAELITDARVTWRTADAQVLPVGDGEVDAVVCQFGLMFVPDKPLALREMRRVLRKGGRLLLGTWDHLDRNEASKLLHALAIATFPSDPPLFMLTPFSMCDREALRALVAGAGFSKVEVETVEVIGESESAGDFATGMVRGNPLWNQLVERGVDAPAFERAVATALAARFGDRPCRTPLSAHIVTAIA